jgi:hypothetical protein
MDSAFRVNSPPITHQTIDGEVVLVNLATGCYYSLRGTAAALWSWLEAGHSLCGLINRLAEHCRIDAAALEPSVRAWVQELEAEGIVQPVAAAPPTAGAEAPAAPAPLEYAAPVLEKFTDMRELLLLDPIHEVTELGWPHARPEAA